MIQGTDLAASFTLPGTSLTVNRIGYGAMQLAGPHVFGPPRDSDEAIAVLREAVESGVNHIDTSDYYGPHVTNQIIRQALHPYPKGLVIVTKLGARRGTDASWILALSRQELIDGTHDNLKNLGLDVLDVVNLRVGGFTEPSEGSIEEPLTVLAELKRQGLIRHIGLSNVTAKQVAEVQAITEIVCVQNFYNVAQRKDDAFIEDLASQGIAYVPFFPFGRVHSIAIVDTRHSRSITQSNGHAACACLASPSLAQHPADSGDIFPQASPREFEGRVAADFC
jgi:pyridoxine 4-dehydrogenase